MRVSFVGSLAVLAFLVGLGAPLPLPAQTTSPAVFAPLPGAVDATTVTASMIGTTLTVQGKVAQYTPPRSERAPHVLLMEGDAKLEIIFWSDIAPGVLGGATAVPVGARASAMGELVNYRGRTQMAVKSADKLVIEGMVPLSTVAAPAAVPATPQIGIPAGPDGYYGPEVAAHLKDLQGQVISIKVPIAGFKPAWSDRAPNVVTVGTEGSTFEVVYWKKDPPPVLFDKVGSTLYARGKVGEHQGRTQIRVDNIQSISYEPLTVAAPTPAAPPKLTWTGAPATSATYQTPTAAAPASGTLALGDILPALEGRTIRATGNVFAVKATSEGTMMILKDASGQRLVRLAAGTPVPVQGIDTVVEGRVQYNKVRSSPEIVDARIVQPGS
ncbi:hypothetical protein GC173_08005 [bacterium]|nr:hypothetical protein [bacterium]